MRLTPDTETELSQALQQANSSRTKIGDVDLSRLNRVLEYTPEDMTTTVQAGISLAELQARLMQHHQWLPLDPAFPEACSIAQLLNDNLSGPRRCGYGTVRDYLIGIKVALATGEIIRAGGNVVKNVAGYDLCKLFVGSKQTLGIPVEATFKLRPLPEKETILTASARSLRELADLQKQLRSVALNPVIMDLYRSRTAAEIHFVLGFAGNREETEHQERMVRELGFAQKDDLNYEAEFRRSFPTPRKLSILPSKVFETLEGIEGAFVCRLGNGIIYHSGSSSDAPESREDPLAKRVKSVFDPNNVLPEFRP